MIVSGIFHNTNKTGIEKTYTQNPPNTQQGGLIYKQEGDIWHNTTQQSHH